jgi:hypothetical protein
MIVVYRDTPRTLELQPGITYEYPVLFDVAPEAAGFVLSDSQEQFTITLDS